MSHLRLCLPLPSQIVTITTLAEDPSTGPTSLVVTDATPSSLSLSWEPAACGDRNHNIEGYLYHLCLGDISDPECDELIVGPTFTDNPQTNIDGLDCNTAYTFIVNHGVYDDQEGLHIPIGLPTELTVWTSTPGPSLLVNTEITPSSLSFTWAPADCGDGLGYIYRLCEGTIIDACDVPGIGPTFTSDSSVIIDGLTCFTYYTFSVRHGQDGNDIVIRMSSELTVQTSTPGPSSLSNIEITASSLSFTWAPADCFDGSSLDGLGGYIYRLCEGTISDTCEEPAIGPTFTDNSNAAINNLACNTECTFIANHGWQSGERIDVIGISSSLTVWTLTPAPNGITSTQSATQGLTLSWRTLDCGSTSPMNFQYVLCPAEFSIINGECVIPTSNRRKRRETAMMSGQTTSTSVSFEDIDCNEAFTFILAGINGDGMPGEWSDPYELITDGAGATINDLTITNIADGVEVSWIPPNIGCSPTGYIVEYSLVKLDQCMEIDNPILVNYGMVTDPPVTITGFIPHSSYHVYVSVATPSGESGPSTSTTLHTVSAAVPPAAPQDVTNTDRTATTLSFQWQPIPCGDRHGIISAYDCRLILASTGELIREFRLNQPNSPFTTVFGLSPLVQYGFSVAADIRHGDNDTGPYSDVALATTLPMTTSASGGNNGNSFTATVLPLSATVYIARPSYSVNEGAGYVSIIIQQTPGTRSSTEVVVSTLADTATPGADFESFNTVLTHQTILPYEVMIPIVADQIYEGNEYFYVRILSPSVSGTSMSIITIIDDDEPEPTAPPPLPPPRPASFTFDKPFYYVSELGDGMLPVSVIRSGNTDTAANLRVKSTGTTAFHPQDYEEVDETIMFTPGQTTASLQVMVRYDTTNEGPENIHVTSVEQYQFKIIGSVTSDNYRR
ncbi:fibronectin-like isoform X1 [Amphiura filiformis]|uniref:fibronectin-like isoform X1 n=1 Tax=Amphiura filiformis TaxID=82378 RepID=UPI003B21F06F